MHHYSKQIIYDDCNTILSLVPAISKNPIAAAEFTPFLSLFCGEALKYCTKYNIPLDLQENSSFSVDDIRLKLKLFEDNHSKARKIIKNCDYLQDYIFKHQLRFKIMKSWNIHYNLGIMLDEAKNIVGNSQYGYYIFQDNKLLKKKIEDIRNLANMKTVQFEFVPYEIRSYGQYCGEIVGAIANKFMKDNLAYKTIESKNIHINLRYKDFNTNKHFSRLYNNDDGKMLFLYVLHILTFINSTIKLLGLFEKDDCGWWLRLYYIAYYYSIRRLMDIKNHLDNSKLITKSIGSELDVLLDTGENMLSHSQFRNCMMHYDLYDKNGRFLISQEYLNLDIPLFGLVESCFSGITYVQLKLDIVEKLNTISDVLSEWLDVSIKNSSEF
jgi:hypothetical protein